MNTNIQDLSNAEMRHLLNQLILNDSGSEKLTKNLIEMETKILFSCTPLLLPASSSGAQVLAKLKSKLIYKAFAKWFIGSALVFTSASTVLYLNQQDQPEQPRKSIFSAVEEKREKSDSVAVKDSEKPITEMKSSFAPHNFKINEPGLFLPIKKLPPLSNVQLLPSEILIRNNKPFISNADTQSNFNDIHTIKISSECTNIQIIGIPGNKKAQVELIGKTKSEKDDDHQFEIHANSENGELNIDVHDKAKKKLFGNRKKVDPVDLILKVNGNVILEIYNSSGEINIQGITGEYCKINNEYGKVSLQKINALADIQLESGNVDAVDLSGKTKIQCNYGNIHLKNQRGDLNVSVNSGNFSGESLEGDANIEVNYGNVSVEKSNGAVLKVNTNSGNFTLSEAQNTLVDIDVNYGNLKLMNTQSELKLHSNSGNISIDEHKGFAVIKSDYGNQDIKNQHGNLSIASNSGKILLENVAGNLEIAADYSNVNLKGLKGDLKARLESGNFIGTGVLLQDQAHLTTSYGNITIQTENKLADLNCDLAAESGNVRVNKEGSEIHESNGKVILDKGKIKILARADSGNILLE